MSAALQVDSHAGSTVNPKLLADEKVNVDPRMLAALMRAAVDLISTWQMLVEPT
jgi:hypothetical protein